MVTTLAPVDVGARLGLGLLAGVLAVYAILAFRIFSPQAVYSGDIGVKYVQARSLADHRFRRLDIPYRAAFLDPEQRFVPFRPPFALTVDGQLQAIFPPGTALVDGVFVALADMSGMVLASFASAAVVLWAAWRLGSGQAAAAIPLLLGLATPLWFYGCIGWEHAPAVAFAMLAFWAASRSSSVWGAALAGLLLATGASLRDEVILLAPGLTLAVWWIQRTGRAPLAACAGLGVGLAAAGLIEVWWFHRPLAAHLQHAVHLLRNVLQAANTPNPDVPSLQPLTVRERYETVIQYWLLGYSRDLPIALSAAGLALALAVRWGWQARAPLAACLVALVALSVWDTETLLAAPKWVPGLYRLSPFLVFAVIPSPDSGAEHGWLRPVATCSLVSYLLLAFAGADTSGGKALGPRLLLPLLPLLTVAAWQGIVRHLHAPRPIDRWIGRLGLTLVVAAFAVQLGSTIPAYARRSAEEGAAVQYLRADEDTIIVADDPFTAQLLLPLYYRKIILLADSPPLADALGAMLARQSFSSALVVSRDPQPRIGLPGYRRMASASVGRMVIEHWHR
jgi:hypothetical protein